MSTSGNTAKDEINFNHGIVVGTADWLTTGGFVGGGIMLDGATHIAIPNEMDFDIAPQITVAAWTKVETLTKGWQAFVGKGDHTWRWHYGIGVERLRWDFTDYSGAWIAGYQAQPLVTDLQDSQWHHVAGVFDGSNWEQMIKCISDPG